MKIFFTTTLFFILLIFRGFSQSENEIIASMDTTAFDGRIFLNKGGIIKEFVDLFIKKDKDNAFINMSARHFKCLYESIGRSDLKTTKI